MTSAQSNAVALLARALTFVLFLLLGAMIVCSMIAIVFEPDEDPFAIVLGMIALIALCDASLLTALLVLSKRLSRIWLALPGVVLVGAGSCALIMLMLFDRDLNYSTEEKLGWAGGIGLALGIALLHTAVFLNIVARVLVVRIARVMTIGAIWTASSCLIGVVAIDMRSSMNWGWAMLFAIVLGIAMLVVIAGTIITPILAFSSVNKKRSGDETLSAQAEMAMNCPNCASEMTAHRGVNRCSNCRARCFVEFEEPRCACGYPLYKLAGNTCPECGRTVVIAVPASSSPD